MAQGKQVQADLIHIAYGPALSDRELNWEIALLEMSPADRCVIHNPHIIKSAVKSRMVGLPAIATGARTLGSLYPTAALVIDVPWGECVNRSQVRHNLSK